MWVGKPRACGNLSDSELGNRDLLVILSGPGNEETLKSYMAARDQLAIRQYLEEEAERKKSLEEDEARANIPVNRAY